LFVGLGGKSLNNFLINFKLYLIFIDSYKVNFYRTHFNSFKDLGVFKKTLILTLGIVSGPNYLNNPFSISNSLNEKSNSGFSKILGNVGGLKLSNNNKPYVNKFFNNDFFKKMFLHSEGVFSKTLFYTKWVPHFYVNSLSDSLNFYKNVGVNYSNTNIVKFIDLLTIGSYNNLFLRKSKIFNKGRYSRNRQFYRTGVYWCLYLSIILFTGLYYWFYHFIINFGFFW
jgi:hypothetical protein